MRVTIHTEASTLPALPDGSYFHSRELMELCLRTPRHKPYMAVVTDDDGEAVANLLAVVRYSQPWFPALLHRHVRILGEGAYRTMPDDSNGPSRNMLFSMMLDALTKRLHNRTLYMEVSHLSQKMFGYAPLRAAGPQLAALQDARRAHQRAPAGARDDSHQTRHGDPRSGERGRLQMFLPTAAPPLLVQASQIHPL